MQKKRKIYPCITTTDGNHFEKLKEINSLGIKEACFFPSCLNSKQRKSFYLELEKSTLEKIPFIHLREDIELWEIEFFAKKYQTKLFNSHSASDFPIPKEWIKFHDRIYIENTIFSWDRKEIKNFAGICLDFSHLEDTRLLRPEIYEENIKVIKNFPCGCAHISAVKKDLKHSEEWDLDYHSDHYFDSLSEIDYLKNYPKKYFPQIIALELENPIKEQLRAKEYIEKILGIIRHG